jgi:hypothetical protein
MKRSKTFYIMLLLVVTISISSIGVVSYYRSHEGNGIVATSQGKVLT